jgi:hypothetical protein
VLTSSRNDTQFFALSTVTQEKEFIAERAEMIRPQGKPRDSIRKFSLKKKALKYNNGLFEKFSEGTE